MILGNTLFNLLYALVALVIALAVALLFKFVILKKLKSLADRTQNTIDDVIVSMLLSIKLPVYIVIAIYIAIQFLTIHPTLKKVIDAVFIVSLVYQLVTVTLIFLDYSVTQRVNATNGSSAAHIKDMIQLILKVSLWAFGLLFILSNLGVNVTSLIAGFGIGGVAVALAVQSILGDLFSYFAIYFDKPFVKDDFIVIGTQSGIVEKVGVKTTRIRALQGEELIIPNSELTSTRIQNFKKMIQRRIVFSFGVTYETPLEKLEKIPNYVRTIVTAQENIRFDRAHLLAFGDSAYQYEVVYYVLSGDFNLYMDIQQSINFQLISIFSEENIEFAYPTQTLHITPGH